MLDADPKFINELYDIFLQEVPEDSAITPTRDNPIADSRFRILMFNQGVVPGALRENIWGLLAFLHLPRSCRGSWAHLGGYQGC